MLGAARACPPFLGRTGPSGPGFPVVFFHTSRELLPLLPPRMGFVLDSPNGFVPLDLASRGIHVFRRHGAACASAGERPDRKRLQRSKFQMRPIGVSLTVVRTGGTS